MGQQQHKQVEGVSYILQVPPELLSEIVIFLDPKDIIQLFRVCRHFRDALIKYDDRVWKSRLSSIFADIPANISPSDFMRDFHIKQSELYAVSWKCIYLFARRGIFRFDLADAKEDIHISEDRTHVQTGIPPATKLKQVFHILLLHPGIPRNSVGIYQVSIKIDTFGIGLWLGVSRKNFQNHTWLGEEEDSWGWGNHCREFYWNYKGTSQVTSTPLENFNTGDVVTMKVDMKNKTLQFIKNTLEGCLLDLNKIPYEDDLHFAVGLYEYPMAVTLGTGGFQVTPMKKKEKKSFFK